MNYYGYEFVRESDLTHHGILGQKWGVRRFQNDDGTWTAAGKERYGTANGSFKGTIHRNMADVYDMNARYYEKHGNKQLASANRQAMKAQLQKARDADRAKADEKIAKLKAKQERRAQERNEFNQNTLNTREKNLAKLKANSKKSSEKIKDFQEGTKSIKAGQKKVNDVIGRYDKMTIAAVKDRSIKRSSEYKQAREEYNRIVRTGIPMSTLAYAMADAAERATKNK